MKFEDKYVVKLSANGDFGCMGERVLGIFNKKPSEEELRRLYEFALGQELFKETYSRPQFLLVSVKSLGYGRIYRVLTGIKKPIILIFLFIVFIY